MTRQKILVGAKRLVEIEELTNGLTGANVTDATVTFTLLDTDGNAVTGAEDVSMTYVASNANSKKAYQGILDGTTVSLTRFALYVIEITANSGEMIWRIPCKAH